MQKKKKQCSCLSCKTGKDTNGNQMAIFKFLCQGNLLTEFLFLKKQINTELFLFFFSFSNYDDPRSVIELYS